MELLISESKAKSMNIADEKAAEELTRFVNLFSPPAYLPLLTTVPACGPIQQFPPTMSFRKRYGRFKTSLHQLFVASAYQ